MIYKGNVNEHEYDNNDNDAILDNGDDSNIITTIYSNNYYSSANCL